MKKTFVLIGAILILTLTPLTALDCGVHLNAGIRPCMINVYVYQDAAFRIEFNDTFGAELGVDLMENFAYAPYFYFSPSLSLYAGGFYIAGGVLFNSSMNSLSDVYPWGELGWRFFDWQVGPGVGKLDIGLNVSPTIAVVDSEDPGAAAVGTIFTTLFSLLKLKVGFSWYLPL